jgi:sugar lactone lactonase YvrE
MNKRKLAAMRSTVLSVTVIPLAAGIARPQSQSIDFSSERWSLVDAEIATRYGRECLSGTAYLNDLQFQDGVIEVDIAADGTRSYPGIIFRMQSEGNYERLYVRPHRAGLYPDAIQYTPVFNRLEGWQLYNGTGYTAAAELPPGEWVRLRLEVKGKQARVYLGERASPAMVITDLKHGVSSGTLGVLGPKNETACFSNFSYTPTGDLTFGQPPTPETHRGTITDWEISRTFPAERADRQTYPGFYTIFFANWQKVNSEATGLVDIARYAARSGPEPDLVLARTVVNAANAQSIRLSFGYSDEIDLFLNGRKVFAGNSSYRSRDPSFLGVVGLYDTINLRLERGLNEILLMVTESFGGWGFMARADRELQPPVADHSRTTSVWETPDEFLSPESVLYDPARDVIYVTNFDARWSETTAFTGYISRLSLDGDIEELRWVTELNAPTGMGFYGGRLWVVERGNLTEIDPDRGELLRRYPISGSEFLNDVAIDSAGNIYLSDTSPSSHTGGRIYRFKDGVSELWVESEQISRANGLFVHGDKLLVGNSGDGFLKAVGLNDKHITEIACLGGGVLDGIRVANRGGYLVSHWKGQVYAVAESGGVVEVLDTAATGMNSADFEYIPDRNLLIIPTFLGNKVAAYRLTEQ